MMMSAVPEESLNGQEESCSDCSSLSNTDNDLMQDLESLEPTGLLDEQGTELQAVQLKAAEWRNGVMACLSGTGVFMCIFGLVLLTQWNATSAAAAVFVVFLALAFAGIVAMFYTYDQHVQKLHNDYHDATAKAAADYLGSGKTQPVYAMSSYEADSVVGGGSTLAGLLEAKAHQQVRKIKVTSLLKNPWKSFRNRRGSADGGAESNQSMHEQAMANGMASTESINNFLGAVRRDTTFLRQEPVPTPTGGSEGGKDGDCCNSAVHKSQPVAEFFAETTVLFADIAGFTAWSSVREPSQVFTLLENLFHAFDTIAQRRKVFKVETVGDCYVAVTGLPQPTKEHAVIMAYFARDCIRKMPNVCKKLERQLGPDTGDLKLRIGMHSGAVTGGVLRGKRSRFQLFGDTVNTAARVESTGMGGRIHLSDTTAELLKDAGKSHWVTKRENEVVAKGKGAMQTYFLQVQNQDASEKDNLHMAQLSGSSDDEIESEEFENTNLVVPVGAHESHHSESSTEVIQPTNVTSRALSNKISNAKLERMISWNVDLLHRLLKQVVARREILVRNDPKRQMDADESIFMTRDGTLLDEVQESIVLPMESHAREAMEQAKTIYLDPIVYSQLEDYVRTVANMYTTHPFHNFEHASHVTMSVAKLLSRIVAPSAHELKENDAEGQSLHDHTYGITSDPLTQFTCVLSALIHDADHPGVPNAQLVKEETEEAEKYKGKSVAEQNSVDKCWNLLMEPQYEELRKTIYTTSGGLARFRHLLVNSVLATDICDKDLKGLRNARWDRAFNNEGSQPESEKAAKDRKATIVIEHLIQASDVSHTMQHWHVFRRWNERLFRECYKAYKEGRSAKDPSEFWYDGEKGFFDFYIIPLAKKLKECGVFGVSSSEYLDYALKNRTEWEEKGEEVVREMVASVHLIEQQTLAKERQLQAARARLAQEQAPPSSTSEADSSTNDQSSGMLSFTSDVSLGDLGPLK